MINMVTYREMRDDKDIVPGFDDIKKVVKPLVDLVDEKYSVSELISFKNELMNLLNHIEALLGISFDEARGELNEKIVVPIEAILVPINLGNMENIKYQIAAINNSLWTYVDEKEDDVIAAEKKMKTLFPNCGIATIVSLIAMLNKTNEEKMDSIHKLLEYFN